MTLSKYPFILCPRKMYVAIPNMMYTHREYLSKTDLFNDPNPFIAICRHLNDIACYGGSTISCRWWPRNRYYWPTAFYNVGLSRCTWCFCVKKSYLISITPSCFVQKFIQPFSTMYLTCTHPDSGPSRRSMISCKFYVKTLLLYIFITFHLGKDHSIGNVVLKSSATASLFRALDSWTIA